MDYTKTIFERLNLQHIREFLLNGAECVNVSDQTYEQRLEGSWKPVLKMLNKRFRNTAEKEKAISQIHNYASTNQNVYMEIGMQCGIMLITQLLSGNK